MVGVVDTGGRVSEDKGPAGEMMVPGGELARFASCLG